MPTALPLTLTLRHTCLPPWPSGQRGRASSQGSVTFTGSNMTLADGGNKFADTVVGFDQSVGDRIHLTSDSVANAVAHSTQVNGGADTLITLGDGSTILLKGVSHIDSSFFS